MRKLILTGVMVVLWGAMSAQMWCPAGAEWYYGMDTGANGRNGYYHIKYAGDTLINGHVCKRMRGTEVSHSNVLGMGATDTVSLGDNYTYADTSKVYVFELGQYYTLYDFGASVGSTWVIPAMQLYSGCAVNGIVTVTAKGSMVIGGQLLRYVDVIPHNGSSWFFGSNAGMGGGARIIEKIGLVNASSCSYLFPNTSDSCDNVFGNFGEGQYARFRCYSDSSGFSYSLFSQCDAVYFPIGIKEEEAGSAFIVLPNPASGIVMVRFEREQKDTEIKLEDMMGKVVYKRRMNSREQMIDVSQLAKGVYCLRAEDKEHRVWNKKMVVN